MKAVLLSLWISTWLSLKETSHQLYYDSVNHSFHLKHEVIHNSVEKARNAASKNYNLHQEERKVIKEEPKPVHLTQSQKQQLVEMHNVIRSNILPYASDMNFLLWNSQLESIAEAKVLHCRIPMMKVNRNEGINIHIGKTFSVEDIMKSWTKASGKYDIFERNCKRKDGCGEFLQVVWADTSKIGCAAIECHPSEIMTLCHYDPIGNVPGEFPYNIGQPCTNCLSGHNSFCYRNMCIPEDICRKFKYKCFCNIKQCHNCGKLIKNRCQCRCPDGWDGQNCAQPCENKHKFCEMFPGWTPEITCNQLEIKAHQKHCRKMCSQCLPVTSNSKELCCEGKICSYGKILNTEECECQPLCPGPVCNNKALGLIYISRTVLFAVSPTLVVAWNIYISYQ